MPLDPQTVLARNLRRNATDAECILWRALREQLPVWKFRRQHPIGARIADFGCPARKLVIELDGGQHAAQAAADAQRTEELPGRGWRVIRFWNNDVVGNLAGVMDTIRSALEAPTSPRPSSPQLGAEGE